MRLFRSLTAISALGLACAASGAPLPDAVPIEVFAAPPQVESPALSPDGSRVAAKIGVAGKQTLVIRSLFDSKVPPKVVHAGSADINWWKWVNDDWLIVGVGDQQMLWGEEVYVTRTMGISATGPGAVRLDWNRSGIDADDLIWVARDGSPRVLLSRQTGIDTEDEWHPSVWEVDVSTGKATRVLHSVSDVYEWEADPSGFVRLGYAYKEGDVNAVLYRGPGARKFDRIAVPKGGSATVPHIFLPDGNAIAFSDAAGRAELYELALPSFTLGKKLFTNGQYDLEGTVSSVSGDGLDGVMLTDKRPRVEWLNPLLKDVQQALDQTLGAGNATIISWSRDRSQMLVDVGSPSQAGAVYYWDTGGDRMQRLEWYNAALKNRTLSPLKTIEYKARDGTRIEAVLTLPRGREAKGLPLIVMPHGGPAARDSEQYDWWTQFLAEQGYAVIQPNYRGSSGYGKAFLELGEGEWGLKMQDDLLDAVAWAAGEGIADVKRVCIVGASYGGYAAMRGAQRDGNHYRCAVSYAGVSDLAAMQRYDRRFLAKKAKAYWKSQVRDFTAVSPKFHAATFGAPILIAHGAKDKRVPVKQSRMLAQELKKAGKAFDYLEQREGDHHFSRGEDRLEFLRALKAFLDRHNPA